MDYQDIENLMSKDHDLPKYKQKRWVKIQDENRGNYNTTLKYNCGSVAQNLIHYSSGYILIEGKITSTTATNLAAGNNIAFKNGSNCIIDTATVRLNNNEVDKNHHVYLTTTYANLLEYCSDFTKNATQYGFAIDSAFDATTTSHTLRKNISITGFANNSFDFMLKIPLTYLSPFFRRLNFPVINNKLDLELELRLTNCLLRAGNVQAAKVNITNTELHLPLVELPSEYEKKFFNMLDSSYTKQIKWDHMDVHIIDQPVRGNFDRQIVSSLDGVRKMYVMAVPIANWNNQEHSETTSNVAISNINITIDSQDYFPGDIRNDVEAYSLLQDCFNMGGTDFNTGSLISFVEFKDIYRLYVFDLSHQKVFESDPKKSQSIRLRCNLPNNDHRLVIVLSQAKTTEICMNNSSKTRTV